MVVLALTVVIAGWLAIQLASPAVAWYDGRGDKIPGLERAVAWDPQNAELHIKLGHAYAEWWLAAAALLLALAFAWPSALAPLNRLWLRLGLVLYKVMNPLVMGLVFFTTVVPICWGFSERVVIGGSVLA